MEDKRTSKVTVLVTPNQAEYLRTVAFNERMTISTYIYNLIVNDQCTKEN